MSISLTDSDFFKYEPLRTNWFIATFEGLPAVGTITGDKTEDSLSMALTTCSIPTRTVSENTFHRINDVAKTPGKTTWEDVDMTFNEYESGKSGPSNINAGKILYEWQNKIHDAITSAQGSKDEIAKTVTIIQFNGEAVAQRVWTLYNAWPKSVKFDGLKSESGDILTVSLTLSYDYATMNSAGETTN